MPKVIGPHNLPQVLRGVRRATRTNRVSIRGGVGFFENGFLDHALQTTAEFRITIELLKRGNCRDAVQGPGPATPNHDKTGLQQVD